MTTTHSPLDTPMPGLLEHIGNLIKVARHDGHGPVFEVFQDHGDHLWRFRELAGGNTASSPSISSRAISACRASRRVSSP